MVCKISCPVSGEKTVQLQVVDLQSGSHGMIQVLPLSACAVSHRVRFCNLGATLLKLYARPSVFGSLFLF